MGNQFDMLDTITLIRFMMQLQNNSILQRQATNDDILRDLHTDVDRLEKKLDAILAKLNSHHGT